MRIVKVFIGIYLIVFLSVANISFAAKSENINDAEYLGDIKAQLALEFFRNGDIRSALSTIEEAVRANSKSVPAWLVRAQIYQYMQQPAEVERSFQRAFSSAQYGGEVSNNYGWYLCESGQVPKSIAYFDKAVADRTYPSTYIALMNKGICQGRMGQHDAANKSLIESVSMAPEGYPFPVKELAKNNLAGSNAPLAELYFQQYAAALTRDMTAEDLLLGVKIGRLAGKHEWVGRYISQLRNVYPLTKEFQEAMSGSR